MALADKHPLLAALGAAGEPSEHRHAGIGFVPAVHPLFHGKAKRVAERDPGIDLARLHPGDAVPILRRPGGVGLG